MACGHYCRKLFPRSLWSKKLISIGVLFSMVTEWWVSFVKRAPVKRTMHVTLCDLEPAGTGTVSWNYYSQLALLTTEWQGWVANGDDIFKNLLNAQVCINCEPLHEVKLNSYFKFISYYACLLFCSIYFQLLLPSILSFKQPKLCNHPKSDTFI